MRCEVAEELRIDCRDVFLEDNLDTRRGETFQIQVVPPFRAGQGMNWGWWIVTNIRHPAPRTKIGFEVSIDVRLRTRRR